MLSLGGVDCGPAFFIFKNPEPKTEPGSMKTQKVVVIG